MGETAKIENLAEKYSIMPKPLLMRLGTILCGFVSCFGTCTHLVYNDEHFQMLGRLQSIYLLIYFFSTKKSNMLFLDITTITIYMVNKEMHRLYVYHKLIITTSHQLFGNNIGTYTVLAC